MKAARRALLKPLLPGVACTLTLPAAPVLGAQAWQDSFTGGEVMVKTLKQVLDQGAAWQPKAVEVPAVVVTKDTVDQFVKDHPDAVGN